MQTNANFDCRVYPGMAPPSNPPDNDAKTIESAKLMDWEPPKAQGLYDPQNEHEACGVGFIVAIDGKRNHKVGEAANCVTVMSIIIIKLAFQCNNFNFVVGQTQKNSFGRFRIILSVVASGPKAIKRLRRSSRMKCLT